MKTALDTEQLENVGQNIQGKVEDNHLILVIDLNTEIGFSSTGKMMGIASTNGFAPLPNNLKGNIYIGKMKAK